jgi:hypothetical protein
MRVGTANLVDAMLNQRLSMIADDAITLSSPESVSYIGYSSLLGYMTGDSDFTYL